MYVLNGVMAGNRGSKAIGRGATNKLARGTRGGDAAGAAGDGHAVHNGGSSAVMAKYSNPTSPATGFGAPMPDLAGVAEQW